MLFKASLVAAAASVAVATDSICDRYTAALLSQNNATNQYTLIKLLVNTAVIGNFTAAPVGSAVLVPGILNPNGTYNSTPVNLVPYFNGGLLSSNRNGVATAVNFLDGGGATPLQSNEPATDTTSNQYMLLTHLYGYFGALLGCSQFGMGNFTYDGETSQYNVHKYMDLGPYEMGYFITQVALSAQSFGVNDTDIAAAGAALTSLFNYKCLPATNVTTSTPELQSMCIDPSCPLAANASCSSYDAVLVPVVANSSLAMGEGASSTSTVASSGVNTATTISAMASTTMSSSSGGLQTAGPIVGAVLAAGAFALAL